jgi:hypothetical protein
VDARVLVGWIRWPSTWRPGPGGGLAADMRPAAARGVRGGHRAGPAEAAQALAGALLQARAICPLSDRVLRVGPLPQALLDAAAAAAPTSSSSAATAATAWRAPGSAALAQKVIGLAELPGARPRPPPSRTALP